MDLDQIAHDNGLDLVGVVPAGPAPDWARYQEWVAQGYGAGMAYLARSDALHKRQDVRHVFPEARSVLVAAVSYGHGSMPQRDPYMAVVSRYAWGEDYHHWVLERLESLVDNISRITNTTVNARCYVDTGPILERSWAQRTGMGWIGKNTCLINPQLGSFVFLGVALLDIDLSPTRSHQLPTCGSCVRCLEACPTGALVAPGVLDANRCLSYLTIEHRGPIPNALRASVGNRIFGCDVCQDVCPWNVKTAQRSLRHPIPNAVSHQVLDVREIVRMKRGDFHARFRLSPIARAKPEGLARNAAVVLGNLHGVSGARSFSRQMAREHWDSVVRDHLEWAERHLSES